MEFTLKDALISLRPNEKWSILGEEIHWSVDNATTQPTEAELNAELERLKKFSPKKRKPHYPPIGDQLDDLYHAGVFSDEMAAKIKAVKDNFPKE